MRYVSLLTTLSLAVILTTTAARSEPENEYEWCAVAPIIVSARSLGDNGRYHEMTVERVLRGDVLPGATLRIDLKQANRSRNVDLRERAVHPEIAGSYLLLLEPGQSEKARKQEAYWVVRGIHGIRDLPEEGAEPILDMMSRFVEIQELKSDSVTWQRFSEMLGAVDPRLVSTALHQFRKFRRGDAELVDGLRPLLDHPQPEIRGQTAGLLGQILGRYGPGEIPEAEELKTDLVSRATRDSDIDVRVASTEALRNFDDATVVTVLEGIADSDPEQRVRFAAEKLLLERRESAEPTQKSRGPRLN